MSDIIVEIAAPRPLWKRIADFPLVALLIAVATFIFASFLTSMIMKVVPVEKGLVRSIIGSTLVIALVLTGYKLVIRHLGEQPRDDLATRHALRDLGLGLGGGFLLFSLVVGVAALSDVYNIVGPGGTATLLLTLVTVAIIPGFIEEVLFRGILFRFLEAFGGSWFALALTSALFGLGHYWNDNATAFSSFAIAVEAGVLLGGAYMLTRSLWAPIGLHAAWNFTQGFIYDVPVSGFDQQGMVEAKLSGPELLSGGAFGLEASVIALVLATAAGVWLVVRAVRAGHVVRPWWVRRRISRGELVQTTGTPDRTFAYAGLVLIALASGLAAYALFMNTAVSTPVGSVQNIGLLANRQNLILGGGFLGIIGVLLVLFGRRASSSAQ